MTVWRDRHTTLSFVVPDEGRVTHATGEDPARAPGDDDHRVWWAHRDDCDGGTLCDCGRVTLLEALERLEPKDRDEAVRLHADEVRALYDHFWSGQGLVSGARLEIGEACVHCLTDGERHVRAVHDAARLMAEEFGEALAAYAYRLILGGARFHPQNGEAADARTPLRRNPPQ